MHSDDKHDEVSDPRWRWWSLLLPLLALAASILLVDPRGDFPLDDDWSFALSTWRFVDTGRFELARFSGMALKTQILWGALWTTIFGKSFVVLRFSTLLLAALSLPLLTRYLVRLGLSPRVATLVTFVLLVHPIFFWSSFTYMTHVPFFFLTLVGVICLTRGLSDENVPWSVAGIAAIVAGYFLRQTGVGTAAGILLAVLFLGRIGEVKRWRVIALIVFASMVLFVVVFFSTDLLLGNRDQASVHLGMWKDSPLHVVANVAELAFVSSARAAMNFVLFALPLTLPFIFFTPTPRRPFVLAFALLLSFFLAPASFLVGTANAIPTPSHGDIFDNVGLGPRTLRDIWIFRNPYPIHLDASARAVFTYSLAVLSAAFFARLIVAVWFRWKTLTRDQKIAFALLSAACVGTTLLLVPGAIYFDRHSLDAMWFVLPLAALIFPWKARGAQAGVALLTLAMAFFSIGATAEYHDWNRARWKAFHYLRSTGVTLAQMDGGFEINQYLIGGFNGKEFLEKAGMSVIDDQYILAFTPVKGYRIVKAFPYRGYFGLFHGNVYVEYREVPFVIR
jgi:hypothetical protein